MSQFASRERLPFVPAPIAGEVLSSWLRRIAAEYGVSLERLAEHLLLSGSRPTQIDHAPTRDDIERTAAALSVAPAVIRAMVHRPLDAQVRRLRETYAPVQVCAWCRADHASMTDQPVAIMAWFEYWRIECQQCGHLFSNPGRPNLSRVNPAREDLEWFARTLPFARRGAAHLATYVHRPRPTLVSPVAFLRLLSMRLRPFAPGPTQMPPRGEDGHHRIAELFLPDLHDRFRQHPLLPSPWTERRPVRLLTARAILLAALANSLADPRAAYARIVGSLDWTRRRAVERWLDSQPQHLARVLDPERQAGRSAVWISILQQSRDSNQCYTQVSCSDL